MNNKPRVLIKIRGLLIVCQPLYTIHLSPLKQVGLQIALCRTFLNSCEITNNNNLNRKAMKRLIGIVAIGLAVAFNTSILAQTHYEVKSHNLVIEGTSNLHDWTADVENLKGNFRIKVEDNKIVDIENLTVKVDANSLKGSRGNMMNSKIYEALDSKKHPEISFELRKVNSISENQGSFRLNTTGILQVSGVNKPVNLNAVGKVLAGGDIEFTGSTKIKMSDFSVKPPTAMLGALTTGDEVTLKYTVVVERNLLSDK